MTFFYIKKYFLQLETDNFFFFFGIEDRPKHLTQKTLEGIK